MFDKCKSLAELNAARIKAVSEGVDITEVNNAYNAKRYQIINQRKPFTVVDFKPVPNPKPAKYSTIPILGASTVAGAIIYTNGGFYV